MKSFQSSASVRHSLLPKESAYTLFEIMLVLGIIAVLVGSAIYALAPNLDIAKKQRVTSDIQAISMQLRTYEMLNYRMPTTEQGIQALVQMPTADPKPAHWQKVMDSVPLDPWGQQYMYRNPGKYKTDGYDLYSLGPQGKDGDESNIGR
jgi:general secretion pathway protein G